MTIAASEFHYTPDYILNMPYFLLVRMIEERNIMNSSWKSKKKKGKAISINEMSKMGGVVIERG